MTLVLVNTLPYKTTVKLNSMFNQAIDIEANNYTVRQFKVNATVNQLKPILITAGRNGEVEFINGVKTGVKVQLLSREEKQNTTTLYIGFEGNLFHLV